MRRSLSLLFIYVYKKPPAATGHYAYIDSIAVVVGMVAAFSVPAHLTTVQVAEALESLRGLRGSRGGIAATFLLEWDAD